MDKNHAWYGRKHTEASKEKMRLTRKGTKIGDENSNWKGGRKDDGQGYILIYCPSHPHAINNRYAYEHRLVMEKYIGRVLLPTEIVHHINHNRADNRIENLMLFSNHSSHKIYHDKKRKVLR